MAQIEEENRRKSKNDPARKSLRVDLTPMVDLGFLLLTFFILTTTLSEPTVARLIMPKESGVKTPVKENATITLMLKRNDLIDYYEGSAPKQQFIEHCSFGNLRSVIQQKQHKVGQVLGDRKETVIIISPGNESTYKNFVDALDEIQINDVRHYFVTDAIQ
ncbi:MAG: biopolymer transporter ExbD [Ginsengibacter sp.]